MLVVVHSNKQQKIDNYKHDSFNTNLRIKHNELTLESFCAFFLGALLVLGTGGCATYMQQQKMIAMKELTINNKF